MRFVPLGGITGGDEDVGVRSLARPGDGSFHEPGRGVRSGCHGAAGGSPSLKSSATDAATQRWRLCWKDSPTRDYYSLASGHRRPVRFPAPNLVT